MQKKKKIEEKSHVSTSYICMSTIFLIYITTHKWQQKHQHRNIENHMKVALFAILHMQKKKFKCNVCLLF